MAPADDFSRGVKNRGGDSVRAIRSHGCALGAGPGRLGDLLTRIRDAAECNDRHNDDDQRRCQQDELDSQAPLVVRVALVLSFQHPKFLDGSHLCGGDRERDPREERESPTAHRDTDLITRHESGDGVG